jgi:hypothetical protein
MTDPLLCLLAGVIISLAVVGFGLISVGVVAKIKQKEVSLVLWGNVAYIGAAIEIQPKSASNQVARSSDRRHRADRRPPNDA